MLRNYESIRDLLSRTIHMVRDFLMEEVYHDTESQDLAKEWGISYHQVGNLTTSPNPIMNDLIQLLAFTSLDFGIAIRDPNTGKEITFYAANNLASDNNYDSQTEEVQTYGSDKKGDEDDPHPEPRGLLSDTFFGRGKSEPVEVDGDFDVDIELGKDVIEGEFTEITQRDLEDFETKCENCLDMERLPDSMLCFHCDALGIKCSPPEDPERPEDYEPLPLELAAVIDRRAQRTKDSSIRLLQAAGMLKGEN